MSADLEVIIPCYNYADRVGRAIESALACASVVRVIVINDGSTDDSAAVLDRMAASRGDRLTVIHQANAGPSAARNAGIRAASARWLMLLDADDELVAEGVTRALSLLHQDGHADLVLTSAEACREGAPARLRPAPERVPDNAFEQFLEGRVPVSHGRFIVRRSLISRLPYPESIRGQEDLPVYALMLAFGHAISCQAVTVRIHHHGASLRRQTGYMVDNEEAVVAAIFDHPELTDADRALRARFHMRRLFSIFRALAKAGDPGAGSYFWRAFRLRPFSARWWKQLPRYLRWKMTSGHGGEAGA